MSMSMHNEDSKKTIKRIVHHRENREDLAQSYCTAPYTGRQSENARQQTDAIKNFITRLWTDLRQSVRVTTTVNFNLFG